MAFMSATLRCPEPTIPRAESTIPLAESTVLFIAPDICVIRFCIWVIEAIIAPRSSDMPLMSPTRCLRNCRFWVIGTEDMLIW